MSSGLIEAGKMLLDSNFGKMIVQTGRTSAGAALRLAGLSLIGIAMIKTSDTAARILNQAPMYIGTVAEYINPSLWVNRLNKKTDEYCNKAAFWTTRALKWHSVAKDKISEEAALKHIENQRFKSNNEVNSAENSSKDEIKKTLEGQDLPASAVISTLALSSFFQSVVAVTLAGTVSLSALKFAEYTSPDIDTWNKLAEALNIPVRVVL